MTLEIPLSRGLVSLVDAADFDLIVAAGKWYAAPSRNTFYARHSYWRDGKVRHVQMHTLITGWSFVDHRNGDGLDNRRQNLRPANDSKNQMNARMRSDNPSGFKGVCADRHRWMARIQLDGRRTYLGYFATPQEAAHAYDAAALLHFGEFARPNFPQEIGA